MKHKILKNESERSQTACPFHSVEQVAARWQKSRRSVYRAIESGSLIAHRFGAQLRISDEDLKTYERANRMQ